MDLEGSQPAPGKLLLNHCGQEDLKLLWRGQLTASAEGTGLLGVWNGASLKAYRTCTAHCARH